MREKTPTPVVGVVDEVSVPANDWINFCWKAWEQPNAKKFVAERKRKILTQNEVMKKIGLKKEIKAEKQMNPIEKLKAQIKLENLDLLLEGEANDFYSLEKLLAWQNIYHGSIPWQEFKENWFYCNRCNSYQEGQCICYAR